MPNDWTSRVWREHRAKNLTRAYRDVLLTLRTFRGAGGVAWPSHQTLADRVGCSVRTVSRAIKHARLLGLISSTERRVRRGWRWLRTSNAYKFVVPDAPVSAGLRPVWWRRATTGHDDRGGEKDSKKGMLLKMMAEAARAPDLLAMRRLRWSGR